MLLLLNEHGDPSFLFPNLSSSNINNQLNDLKHARTHLYTES